MALLDKMQVVLRATAAKVLSRLDETDAREILTSPSGYAAIMFAGRRTPDAGRRTPDAGRRTP
ncbi:MAG: hypothetical protein OXC65_05330, partial [Thiotrichales bacterium]|nr:hypothetical protein [Thiotrichales bacterium]